MLQEWNQSSCNRSNLLWSNVHHIYFGWSYKWEVCFKTSFYFVTDECTICIQRCITLSYYKVFFLFCCQINNIIVIKVYFTIFYLTVRSRDKTKVIDFCVNTQRRDKTNIWTLRSFDRTKTTIVCVVNVTNLETSAVTRKTTRTKSRQTAFMCDFCQWVSLVHELRQCISTKISIDDRRYCFSIDKVNWSKHLVIANIHTLTDSTRHTSQTNAELII